MKHLQERILVTGDGAQTRSFCAVDDLVIEMSSSDSNVIHVPLPKDDPTRRKPDIGRAIETLDWTPKVPLSDGLVTTIAYFKELLREVPASRISVFQP